FGLGGLNTTILELCVAGVNLGATYDLSALQEQDSVKVLFNENIGLVLQARDDASFEKRLTEAGIQPVNIGTVQPNANTVHFRNFDHEFSFQIDELRDTWFHTSYLLDQKQSRNGRSE